METKKMSGFESTKEETIVTFANEPNWEKKGKGPTGGPRTRHEIRCGQAPPIGRGAAGKKKRLRGT